MWLDDILKEIGWVLLAAMVSLTVFGLGWTAREAEPCVYAAEVSDPTEILMDSVEMLLAPDARDPEEVRPLARLVVQESLRKRLDPVLVAGIIRVENPWLISDTTSHAGAVGIMQIMPFHEEGWECSGPLTDAGTSICLGTAIFRDFLEKALRRALLDYNGCSEWNRRCQGYAVKVTEGI